MLYARLSYGKEIPERTTNIGDYIQTIAVEKLLPRVDLTLDRDALNEYSGKEPVIVIMNGWFTHAPQNWPPAPNIVPIFVGFHIARKIAGALKPHKEYFEGRGSIGCRDHGTAAHLRSWGIPAHVTYCCTLTFPPREREPANGKICLVDVDDIAIPKAVRKRALKITHEIPKVSTETALAYAMDLINYYRDEAKMVVTTKIHCALPCMAMGIPVVFFGDKNRYRTNIVSDIGLKIYDIGRYRKKRLFSQISSSVDWQPKAIDINDFRNRITKEVKSSIDEMS